MRHYEIVLMVHPAQSEQVPGMLERYQGMVTAAGGRVHRVEDWGRRRLAYMIDEVHKAHYLMLNIECGLDALRELERHFKFNDSIIRNLVIRRAKALTEPSALALAKAEEDRIEAEKLAAQEKAAAEQIAKAAAAAESAAAATVEESAEAGAEAGDAAEAGAAAETDADSKTADSPDAGVETKPADETAGDTGAETAAGDTVDESGTVTESTAESSDETATKPQPETV